MISATVNFAVDTGRLEGRSDGPSEEESDEEEYCEDEAGRLNADLLARIKSLLFMPKVIRSFCLPGYSSFYFKALAPSYQGTLEHVLRALFQLVIVTNQNALISYRYVTRFSGGFLFSRNLLYSDYDYHILVVVYILPKSEHEEGRLSYQRVSSRACDDIFVLVGTTNNLYVSR